MKKSLSVIILLVGFQVPGFTQPPREVDSVWTREDAIEQLTLNPHDLYLQFVATQLSGDPQSVAQLQSLLPRPMDRRQIGRQRNAQINLYSIFSGSLAVQESLQLDAMTGEPTVSSSGPPRQFGGRRDPMNQGSVNKGRVPGKMRDVPIDELKRPLVKSHPWEEMLGGKTSEVSRLAQCVPEDHSFIRFGSVGKLMDMRGVADDWYAYAAGQANGSVRSRGNLSKLQKQWLMETSGLLKPLYDTAFAEVAVTSSDLFFSEGTDATLIMRLKQPDVVRTALDQMLKMQIQQNPQATLETGSFLGIDFTHVTTPDRSIHVYAASPADDLHLRSNSRVAFERIMRTILNQPEPGQAIKRLSDSDEFRYIRTLMPLGAEEEDGFVYLSDPFIRNLIGPEKKLTQRNRLVCRTRLQMLRHAQLLYRTQHGQNATSIEQLRSGQCLGNQENEMKLECPSGGQYALLEETINCRCSHHGSPDAMVPTCEIPVEQVSEALAAEYIEFVEAYSRYWQTFFDPIAVRIRVQPDRTRVETIVLPLINNSIYTSLASVLGGKPDQLDSLPIPEDNIASLALKVDKNRLLEQMGIPHPDPEAIQDEADDESFRQSATEFAALQIDQSLQRIGLGLHNHHSAFRRIPPRPEVNADLSWRVQVLPFLEEQELYSKFKLDEPWDSEHNLPLAKEIPDVFATGSASMAKQGKTCFVFPRHPEAMYVGPGQGTSFRNVLDGLSTTIMVAVTDEQNAVPWTKPDDLDIDLSKPRFGWYVDDSRESHVLIADGRIAKLPEQFPDQVIADLITRAGREVIEVDLPSVRVESFSNRRRTFPDRDRLVKELSLDRFLHQGIGNQIAIHVCDDQPLVDVNVSRMLGMFAGPGRFLSPDSSLFGILALAINTPIYLSIPVEDAKIVDQTLEKLDRFLVKIIRDPNNGLGGMLQIEQDAYQFSGMNDPKIRAYGFRFGPITWRFYWMRIDDGLYIASTPELIGSLRAAANQRRQANQKSVETGAAHAMLRIRPEHWNKIKPHFRIGWAESERRACLNCLSPLSNAAKANLSTVGSDVAMDNTRRLAEHVFGGPLLCPTHGEHVIDPDTGRVSCSLHGEAIEPKQPVASRGGLITDFAESLEDVRLELTFLEDGLHAVVTVAKNEDSKR